MTHVANLVAVILTSSLLRWTPAEASLFCTWAKVLRNGEVHYFFLRGDPLQAPPSLRFYHSSWSGERAPLSCAWSEDAAVIQNYLSLCHERGHEFPKDPDENFDPESMFEAEDLCVPVASPGVDGHRERTGKRLARSVGGLSAAGSSAVNHQGQAERSEVRAHHRVKRGFIVPGTLWCGSGNKAPSYADLGVFADTDSCCREHDQCKHTILSFQSEFGVFNNEQLSCAVYKDLDACRNKILPQQRRYGLHNPEATTLYHCNCTTRLFQTLATQRQLTEVQALLLGHVSQSCFLAQDCTAGKICTAVLVKAELPQLDQRSSTEVEEQRHLQAMQLKVRRPNSRRAKRKDRAVRLHKLCLRMVRPKRNKTRKQGKDGQQTTVRRRELVQM
ncbi:group 3 secretory phospholipase A2 [Morone saxatilis]|uniref:group 3 secretory phospholipase A2 n=1 Tax=Morone saxatilis TaxID=34816 RepID=UPI0015E1D85F|nr:group 3 secretory phospholipase A2 [Morone saxatilis]